MLLGDFFSQTLKVLFIYFILFYFKNQSEVGWIALEKSDIHPTLVEAKHGSLPMLGW
jgi:hypothetical protein